MMANKHSKYMDKISVKVLFCLAFVSIVSLSLMYQYTTGPLGGNFNKYLMHAERWGIPEDLKKRGIESLYLDDVNSGWDGQFYYYVANDLFAMKDTPQHIDADAYRYQRIGVPLLSKLLSILAFQDWVSPFLYYLTNLILILLGTAAAAFFFEHSGVSAYWIIPWSVGLGTQITLLNGLPDGAADALLIMALIQCRKKNYFLYSLAATFACLSREAYIVFPVIFLLGQLFWRMHKKTAVSIADYVYFLLPVAIFIAWHSFIRFKFLHTPSEQSSRIIGLPFSSIYRHLSAGLVGQYPGIAVGYDSYIAAVGIGFFVILLVFTVYFAIGIRPFASLQQGDVFAFSLSFTVLTLISLYICFGDTVIWNFTGYMKAANIFVFIIPFIAALGYRQLSKKVLIFIALLTIFFFWQGWALRVNQPAIRYKFDSNCHHLVFGRAKSCYERFVWRADELPGTVGVTVNSMRTADKSSDKSGFLIYGPYLEVPKGKYRIIVSYSGKGSNLGYLDAVGLSPEGKTETFKKVNLSEGTNVNLDEIVTIPTDNIKNFEVRIWFQDGELAVRSSVIERLPED